MNIAVLLPSRARPELCAESIRSLRETCKREPWILVQVDVDDPCYDAYTDLLDRDILKTFRVVKTVAMPSGYQRLHRYYNSLADYAKIAQADAMLIWNDDARMTTRHWDDVYRSRLSGDMVAVGVTDQPDEPFPLITRAFHQTLGHVSLNAHNDAWVCESGKRAGCIVSMDGQIRIEHLRDQVDDETKRAGVRAQERDTLAELFSPEVQAMIDQDAGKLRAAMQEAA